MLRSLLTAFLVFLAPGAAQVFGQQAETVPPPLQGPRTGNGVGQPLYAADGLIVGSNLLVALGPRGDRIWAFSTKYGNWVRQTLPNNAPGPIVPQITANIVCFQSGSKLYAFSAYDGSWDTTNLDSPAPVELQVSDEAIWCRQGPKIYAYAAKAGQWSNINVFDD